MLKKVCTSTNIQYVYANFDPIAADGFYYYTERERERIYNFSQF